MFDPALLFRLRLRPVQTALKFGDRNWQLPDEAIIPALGKELSGQTEFAELRIAVGENALFLEATVNGKRQLPWCRESRIEDSDGLHVWIDTRNSRDVHRATRYCHRFVFCPMGRGPRSEQPFGGWAPINRARENSNPPPEKLIFAQSKLTTGGYTLGAALHWQALTGLDRNDFPVIGFYATVMDRERGRQSIGLGGELPADEDPSLWSELALVPD